MKLSARKKGQIYDLVHKKILDMRINLRNNYLTKVVSIDNHNDGHIKDKIDYVIAQLEIPLAQEVMKLIEGKSNKE